MSETKKLITLTPSKVRPLEYANQTIIFPVIGEQTMSSKGTLDVQEDKVEAFTLATIDSFGFYEKVEGAVQADGRAKGKAEKHSEEYNNTKKELESLELKDLVELAKESGLDPADLITMTDGKIRAELLKKLVPDSK